MIVPDPWLAARRRRPQRPSRRPTTIPLDAPAGISDAAVTAQLLQAGVSLREVLDLRDRIAAEHTRYPAPVVGRRPARGTPAALAELQAARLRSRERRSRLARLR